MGLHSDCRGLPITAASREAVQHYDEAVSAYLRFGRDTGPHLKASRQADPELVMGHCTKGYFFQLFCNSALAKRARSSLEAARTAAEKHNASTREHAHIAALAAWCDRDLRTATAQWEHILLEHPRDVLALRLAHFTHFYLGSNRQLRDSVARALYAWDEQVPDYGYVLGVYAFGLEESGDLARAELTGRRAVELNPTDIWAVHAAAHVMEMQGRHREGVGWLQDTEAGWRNANNFAYHVWWHRCLFHWELEQYDEVLALYDQRVRADQESDDYLDISNAASLLWRLESAGVDVGERWSELAEKAVARVDDHVLVFADAHFMMTLAATGRDSAARQMLASMGDAARTAGTEAAIFADVGLPLCEALWSYRRGDYDKAVDLLLPIRY
ncbi:MAG: tetratricopeptide repeat protein, partial [Acidiferrobacterales bacterium]